MVNGPEKIFVERTGKIEVTSASFVDDGHLLRIIDKIVSQIGRRVDESSPMVDARLPDGSRERDHRRRPARADAAIQFSRSRLHDGRPHQFGSLTSRSAHFLAACVKGKLSILISGGTGTGKATLLNAMSAYVPGDERIVTIEDAAELQLQQDHVITLESRPANIEGTGEIRIRELVRNSCVCAPTASSWVRFVAPRPWTCSRR